MQEPDWDNIPLAKKIEFVEMVNKLADRVGLVMPTREADDIELADLKEQLKNGRKY